MPAWRRPYLASFALLAGACSIFGGLDELRGSAPDAASFGGEPEGGAATAGAAGMAGGDAGGAAGASAGASGAAACGNDAVCVAPAPLGWTGPVALWQGSVAATPPDCSAASLSDALTAYSNAIWPPASCEPCVCGPLTGGVCTLEFSLGTFTCLLETATLAATEQCAPGSVPDTVSAGRRTKIGVYSGGSCALSGGAPTLSGPIGGTVARACSGLVTGASCGGGQICAFVPPAPFQSALCLVRTGISDCPAAYPNKQQLVTVTDTRSCSACSCDAPASSDCDGTVEVYAGLSCSGTAHQLTNVGLCVPFGAAVGPLISRRAVNILPAAKCTPNGGSPIGDVEEQGVTVCCTD